MNAQDVKNFIKDLVDIIQDEYNQSLLAAEEEQPEERAYRLGSSFAYYDVLDIIHSQMNAFGFNEEEISKIAPALEWKITKKENC
jgi:hypothetical protein